MKHIDTMSGSPRGVARIAETSRGAVAQGHLGIARATTALQEASRSVGGTCVLLSLPSAGAGRRTIAFRNVVADERRSLCTAIDDLRAEALAGISALPATAGARDLGEGPPRPMSVEQITRWLLRVDAALADELEDAQRGLPCRGPQRALATSAALLRDHADWLTEQRNEVVERYLHATVAAASPSDPGRSWERARRALPTTPAQERPRAL